MNRQLQQKIIQSLISVPSTATMEGRDALLLGLPSNVIASLNRSNSRHVDVSNLLAQLETLGRLEQTGERPLIIIAQNALLQVDGTTLGTMLKEIIRELEEHYGGEKPSAELPPIPEILIFEGKDERLAYFFIEQALQVGKCVARLRIPRIMNGQLRYNESGYGTGWLVTSNLIFTNHHVINARHGGEPAANHIDLQAQGAQTVAWFDYHQEGGNRTECFCTELVCYDAQLDYALLRLRDAKLSDARAFLSINRQPSELNKGDRLNIVQHPGGGALRYAIRNNFYIGLGDTANHLRYLTDTEPGSSGSPVLNDSWEVIAMHHAYRRIPKEEYKGEVIKYHNQGIAMQAILAQIPSAVRAEIVAAQGWL